ncbi:hypothetical protein Emed_002983 [Eimeria media]
MVWSPCNMKKPICHLRGHPYSLCGVVVVPGTPQVVTADVSGTLRLWDLRNFRSFQTFGGRGSTIDSYTCQEMPAAEKRRTMQDELTAALHNSQCNNILTVSKTSVISWDAMHGNVNRKRDHAGEFQLEALLCEGMTLEELQNKDHESRAAADDAQTMTFTYKRNIFSPANDAQELIMPACTRAVKLNRFSGESLQVYTADERGYIRLWDLSRVQERLLVEPVDRESGPREGIRFATGSPGNNSPRSGPSAAALRTRRGVVAARQKTFLTQPKADLLTEGAETLEDFVVPRKRRDASQEIRLLHENLGHDGAIMAIDLCDDSGESPDNASRRESEALGCGYHQHWLLSVGSDRVVKVWSLDLQQLGQLTSDNETPEDSHASGWPGPADNP